MDGIRIVPAEHAHLIGLSAVAEETRLFPAEMLEGMLSGSLSVNQQELLLTGLSGDVPAALCYARAEALAAGTWNMLALAVRPALQGRGFGSSLVAGLEGRLLTLGARILIVDTSGSDGFAAVRAFYERSGYEKEAVIRDFWADGDHKVTYRKRLGR